MISKLQLIELIIYQILGYIFNIHKSHIMIYPEVEWKGFPKRNRNGMDK